MLSLHKNAIYRGTVKIPLEFGNREQIKLLKDEKIKAKAIENGYELSYDYDNEIVNYDFICPCCLKSNSHTYEVYIHNEDDDEFFDDLYDKYVDMYCFECNETLNYYYKDNCFIVCYIPNSRIEKNKNQLELF